MTVTDGEHLEKGHDDRDNGGGQRPEEEAADGDDGALDLHLQEVRHPGQQVAQQHGEVGQGRQHGQGRDGFHAAPGLPAHLNLAGGGGGDVGFEVGHKKNTPLQT